MYRKHLDLIILLLLRQDFFLNLIMHTNIIPFTNIYKIEESSEWLHLCKTLKQLSNKD